MAVVALRHRRADTGVRKRMQPSVTLQHRVPKIGPEVRQFRATEAMADLDPVEREIEQVRKKHKSTKQHVAQQIAAVRQALQRCRDSAEGACGVGRRLCGAH